MLLVICIFGPMIYFSAFNPNLILNPIKDGQFSMSIFCNDTLHNNSYYYPIFSSSHILNLTDAGPNTTTGPFSWQDLA